MELKVVVSVIARHSSIIDAPVCGKWPGRVEIGRRLRLKSCNFTGIDSPHSHGLGQSDSLQIDSE